MSVNGLENDARKSFKRVMPEAPEGGWGYVVMLGVSFGFVRHKTFP